MFDRKLLILFVARPEGLEPPAYWFEANRSIQLSYGRAHVYRSIQSPRISLPVERNPRGRLVDMIRYLGLLASL